MTLINQNKSLWQLGKNDAKRGMHPRFDSFWDCEEIVKKLTGKLLDWGCGVGRFYPLFKKYNINYYGVDIMPQMLTYFKEDYGDVNVEITDGFASPFKEKFDVIWSWSILTHCDAEDVANILKEWKRILKDDGEIYCSVMFGDVEKVTNEVNLIYFNKEYFLGLIKEAGFNYEKVLEIYEIENLHQTLFKLKKK